MKEVAKTFLPDCLLPAHNLCFVNHDILVELLRAGEAQQVFLPVEFEFRNEGERAELATSADIFEWFSRTQRLADRDVFLTRAVFPAVLSDFLHFVYEALETSRKGKLTVSYALLRKPLHDSLFLLESIATDAAKFGTYLAETPEKLEARTGGGPEAHAKRIGAALRILGEEDRFDAEFLAQLRYGKAHEDSFAGAADQALHLFTSHPAIKTERFNVNFIFSDAEAKLTQWYYLYSRLPYLLFYARRLVEHVCASFTPTDPEYLLDIERRVAALTLLWGPNIEADYRHPAIDQFVESTRSRLAAECTKAGYPEPQKDDLPQMAETGAYPGESPIKTASRNASYASLRPDDE